MFRRTKTNDPDNTMGQASPGRPGRQQEKIQTPRMRQYLKAVKENKEAFEAMRAGRATLEDARARQDAVGDLYRSLTRSECAALWRPDSPEALDPKRKP